MSVAKRLRILISHEVNDRTRYLSLQEKTRIKSDVWKNFWFERREADTYMLEAISRSWPEYAYWLATGSTDVLNGHMAPKSEMMIEQKSFTENSSICNLPYLKAGVEVIKAIEFAEDSCEDDDETVAAMKTIEDFLEGNAVNQVTTNNWGAIDYAFKAIKEMKKVGKVRALERNSLSKE
jgi:hypothetical protein